MLENLQILLDFVGFTVGSGGSSFGGGNPPIDSKVSDFKVGDLPPTIEIVGLGPGRRIELSGWVDTLNFSVILMPKIHFNLLNWL